MFSISKCTKINRMEDGTVVLHHKECGRAFHIAFSADDWCSMVTAVAAKPDTSETHEKVKVIHGVE